MADIFISYSSKDRAEAEQLTELLSSAGLSVWIDRQGIDVATSWSGEIVDAIDGCTAVVVLLSPHSVESRNVAREVALASEKNKKILPLDLEPVVLSRDLQYHLAGIQRTATTNIDSILRALGTLGVQATQAPSISIIKHVAKDQDASKRLLILPFEDLSPTGDNAWFTDGMASEMISTLSKIKALKVIDWTTSRLLKGKAIPTVQIAREFAVRYFIEGQVRKFGDQLKISLTLLDVETGDHLWQDSLRGTMDDVFDIQEQAATRVLEALHVHLGKDEKHLLEHRDVKSAEAYELSLKANEYFARQTHKDYQRALALFEEAIRVDPMYLRAHAAIAHSAVSIYGNYDRSDALLDRARSATERVRELDGEKGVYFWLRSIIELSVGNVEEALALAKRAVAVSPKYSAGYDALSRAYTRLGLLAEAALAKEEEIKLRESGPIAHFNLVLAWDKHLKNVMRDPSRVKEAEEAAQRVREAAERGLPTIERRVRLNPDDYDTAARLANMYRYAGRKQDAIKTAESIERSDAADATALYNLACLYLDLGELDRGLHTLSRAVDKGYRSIEDFDTDPDLDPIRDKQEFKALRARLKS
jgi:adenylate cyclase